MNSPTPDPELAAHHSIRNVVENYAAAIDRRDLDTAADLFSPNAVLTLPDPPTSLTATVEHRGQVAIRRALQRVDVCLHTLHAIVGHTATVNGHSAVGHTACLAHHLLAGKNGIEDWVWTVHYEDTYVRHLDRWRIETRSMRVDWIEIRGVRHVRPTTAAPAR